MPEEDDQRKGHKFPFLVNEIFSLDSKLNEKFFEIEVEPEAKPVKAETDEISFDDESHEHTDENTKSSDSEEEEKKIETEEEKSVEEKEAASTTDSNAFSNDTDKIEDKKVEVVE